MFTPKQVAQQLETTDQTVRKAARKLFGKSPAGGWNFTEEQVHQLAQALQNKAPRVAAAPLQATVTAPSGNDALIQELTAFANDWLQQHYGLKLVIPLEIRPTLQTALGYFQYNSKGPRKVALAARLFKYYGREVAIDVLKHELVHYALYMLGKPHKDGDPYFENELRKHGITSTGTYEKKGMYHVYACQNCGEVTSHRARQLKNLGRYRSTCCNARIDYLGYQEVK